MTKHERREFLKAALAAMAVAGLGGVGCHQPTAMCYSVAFSEPENTAPPEPAPDDATNDQAARREELTERLEKLGEEEPLKDFRNIQAMCYSW